MIKSLGLSIVLLLFSVCLTAQQPNESVDRKRLDIANIFAELDETDNYSEELSVEALNVLPMGISRTVSTINYTVAISNVTYLSDYVELAVCARVKVPQKGIEQGEIGAEKILFFSAQKIRLSYDGSMLGDATLTLVGDVHIPVNGNRADFSTARQF